MTGVLAGPIAGLRYQTPTAAGLTNDKGEFTYRTGEAVTFLVGDLVLGTADGSPRMNLAQLVHHVAGNIEKIRDPFVTNLGRLVQTLDHDGNSHQPGVSIAPVVHDVVGSMVVNFNQADHEAPSSDAGASAPGSFATDPTIVGLLAKLNATEGVFKGDRPRQLRTAAASRNELRRNIRGIVKLTDVKVPLRDGSFVYADVFRPADTGRHPVVMSMGFYGKAFPHDCICSQEEALRREELEDRYFSGNPDGLQYENHESAESSTWVPQGYSCVRVDPRGVCNSPGEQAPFSVQEAEDYYDAIEWAGTQTWSNGNVGLWGMSYLAMTQHNVASLQPPHLKAMIALGTDADLYNEAIYGGGMFGAGFWNWWKKAFTAGNVCGERRETDWFAQVLATPFNDPAAYGARGAIFMRPDLDKATAAVWILGPQTGAIIHQLGSSETFVHSTSAAGRKFDLVDAWFPYCYKSSTVADHMRFFDHWLKGDNNGVMYEPPVRLQLRTGNGAYLLMQEDEWPIARTEYRRWYLDASPTNWAGDGRRSDLMRIVAQVPLSGGSADFDAHLELGQPSLAPTGPIGGTPRWSTGISFVSDPVPEDMVLAGYMKAGLWVSSTSSDMDVFVSLRVIDEHNREVRYESIVFPVDPINPHPVGLGLLKVSHRRLDESMSTEYWPVHTHLEAHHAPLESGEIVAIELGLNPSSALIRRGCRLRVDIQPYTPAGVPVRAYDDSYHVGARNTVYTGPDHPSYVQLPIVAAKPAGDRLPSGVGEVTR